MDSEYLNRVHQYPLSGLDQGIVDGEPKPLDIFGRQVDVNGDKFKDNYFRVTNFPLKLLNRAMAMIGETMQKYASNKHLQKLRADQDIEATLTSLFPDPHA